LLTEKVYHKSWYNKSMTVNTNDPRVLTVDGTEFTFYWEPGTVPMPLGMTSYAWKPFHTEINSLANASGLKVAEFGAGSGFISVFASLVNGVDEVYAYEKDATCCEYITANAALHNAAVNVVNDDVANVSGMEFDYIISTPPTLPAAAKNLLASTVWRDIDPAWAHFSSDASDSLSDQKVFIAAVAANLKVGGKAVLYHTQSQTDSIAELVTENGLTKIETLINDNHSAVAFSVDPAFTIVTK
jgi:methylase of polypeptide subunit release factors